MKLQRKLLDTNRIERDEIYNKLTAKEISHSIISVIQMDDRVLLMNLMFGLPSFS